MRSRHTKLLLAKGGYEVAAGHYPLIVAFHTAWILGLWWLAPAQQVIWPLIAVFVVLQGLRVWVIGTLGSRWTTRIIRVPNETLVAAGPYRYFKHPNYVVVALEIFVLPAAFGLFGFAVITGVINGLILWLRISEENKALATAK